MAHDQADAYHEKVKAYLKIAPSGKAAVVKADHDKTEWKHWADYFAYVGMPGMAALMVRRELTTMTVPTKDPCEFDPDVAILAIAAGENRRYARASSYISAERRKELTDQLKATTLKPMSRAAE